MFRNPVAFDEFGNPIYVPSFSRKRKAGRSKVHGYVRRSAGRRNPVAVLPPTVRNLFQGIGIQEVVGGLAGLGLAALAPGWFIKNADTTAKKWGKIGVAVGAALATGFIAKQVASPSVAKAAIIGGLAGTASQALSTFGIAQIGTPASNRRLLTAGRNLGAQETVSPSFTREGENVQLIKP